MSATTNRLADETSPYLLQHRNNPVDWYAWGPEAFEQARRDDKPILLSVGYSACHWCHVMAHESFENEAIAALMNRHFVNVKVDREERPDVDAVYMSAVQALTGAGGWPMTVVMTPDGEPFFGGTYFPPDDRFGRPGFPRVLGALADAWHNRRDEVEKSAAEIRNLLGNLASLGSGAGALERAPLDEAVVTLESHFDSERGGFGGAPKFPPHSALALLLRLSRNEGNDAMITTTLDAMARGGIFDQLGGGFARYSVDAIWQVPHFEKMLYDNAQLVSIYVAAYARYGEALYRRTVERTLAWVEREMTAPDGGFYSALDADSEGEEGRFYLWDAAVIESLLGDDAPLAISAFGVSETGNFEGRNILERRSDEAVLAGRFDMSEVEFAARLDAAIERMLEARAIRERPGLDDKVLTSWNGLMLGAYADAGRSFARTDWIDAARRCAGYLHDHAWREGRLFHVLKGSTAKIAGLLEDYSYLGLGLLRLYRATFESRWLLWAIEIARVLPVHFADEDGGGLFTTADDGEALLVRPKDYFDAAVPSGNGSAAELLVQIGRYLGGSDEGRALETLAERTVAPLLADAGKAPTGFATLLMAADRLLSPPREVAVIGPRSDARTAALLEVLRTRELAYVSVAHAEGPDDPLARHIPWLQGRDLVGGAPAAYVCEAGTCRLPVTDPQALAEQLDP